MTSRKTFALLILSLATTTLIGCLGNIFVNSMYPYKSANKVKVPVPAPAPYTEFYVETVSGNKIHSWNYYAGEGKAVVVHFHGNGYNIGGAYEGKLFQLFEKLDFNFVMWDFPSYGLSTGAPSEASLTEASLAVMKKIRSIYPNEKIILWGRSLGTGIATKTAYLLQEQVDALILTSPWDYTYKVAMDLANISEKEARKAAKGNEYTSADYAKDIHIPTLIFHGTLDKTIGFELGQNLYNHFPTGSAQFIIKEGKGHNDLQDQEYWEDFIEFVRSI